MKNVYIEILNEEHGKKVIEFFNKIGINTKGRKGVSTRDKGSALRYYGVTPRGDFDNITLQQVKYFGGTIIPLSEDSPYPKVMLVSDFPFNNPQSVGYSKRVVFMEKNGKFLAWGGAETIEEAEKATTVATWDYAKDIEPEPEVQEYTLEEIAKALGKDVNQIRIKK